MGLANQDARLRPIIAGSRAGPPGILDGASANQSATFLVEVSTAKVI